MYSTDTLSQFQALLSIALKLNDVVASFGLTILEGIEQVLKFFDPTFSFVLRLGFAGGRSVLQFGSGFVQFFLCFAALLFQLGEQFFSISQGLRTSGFQMLEQTARELLE